MTYINEKNEIFTTAAEAVLALCSEYGEVNGQRIGFETLGDSSGIALYAGEGEATISETADITGGRTRLYRIPMRVIYRAAATTETQRLAVMLSLETLGDWLCGETVTFGGEERTRREYPPISGGRIIRIGRRASYNSATAKNGVSDRILPLTVEFERVRDAG